MEVPGCSDITTEWKVKESLQLLLRWSVVCLPVKDGPHNTANESETPFKYTRVSCQDFDSILMCKHV